MNLPHIIDMHMHSTVSDGTFTPAEILRQVKEAGIEVFSLTDHDDVKGYDEICANLQLGDPIYVTGVELSCKDEDGQYHILGYAYDPMAPAIQGAVKHAHDLRFEKLGQRIHLLAERYGFVFRQEDVDALYRLDNPGKPHLAKLMIRYGYADNIDDAIRDYLNHDHIDTEYLRPEAAIRAILQSGGIPVLAHPSLGRGDAYIVGDDMNKRLLKLMDYGLQGVEAFYSTFTPAMQREMLGFAERYGLYVSAGSDYHGRNKTVRLGQTQLADAANGPLGLVRFLNAVLSKSIH